MENVDDHVAVVGDDPLADRVSVRADRAALVILFQAVLYFTRDGLELRLGCSGADDKKIRE